MSDPDLQPTKKTLDRLGALMVKYVVQEARQESDRRKALAPGSPVGLPDTREFYRSFSYEVVGSDVVLLCSYPYIEKYVKGAPPHKLTKLTKTRGVDVVPMTDERGKVIFRAAPSNASSAWVHPGFKKHDFISRGVDRALNEIRSVATQDALEVLSKTDLLR